MIIKYDKYNNYKKETKNSKTYLALDNSISLFSNKKWDSIEKKKSI